MDTTQPRKSTPKQVLLKLPYDPTGPTFNHMKSIFEFEKLEQFLFEMDADKLTLCFRRPPNLRNNSLCRSRLQDFTLPPEVNLHNYWQFRPPSRVLTSSKPTTNYHETQTPSYH
jgi:hypothetical protein